MGIRHTSKRTIILRDGSRDGELDPRGMALDRSEGRAMEGGWIQPLAADMVKGRIGIRMDLSA